MGLFEKVFGKKKIQPQDGGFFETFSTYSPMFQSFGGQYYESEIIRAAINAKANHISKLQINIEGGKSKLRNKLIKSPNEWQTWGQFLYRLETILEVQNTAFIVPVEDEFGETVGIYPILPSNCEMVTVKKEPWMKYQFRSGDTASIPFSDCGIMTKFQYESDFFGENNKSLNPTMELVTIQEQGITEAVKTSSTYKFIARVNNFSKSEDMVKERKRFTEANLKPEDGGILLFPNTYSDIKQINQRPYVVGSDEMKAIKNRVYDYFGVNEDVVQSKAYGDAWSAFYESAIEPFAIQFSDVVTKMIFTEREIAQGAFIMATANRLQYMTNADKLNVSAQMADRGIMNRDEIRAIWNLPPLPEGQGQAFTVRGEYYFLDGDNNKQDDPDASTQNEEVNEDDN